MNYRKVNQIKLSLLSMAVDLIFLAIGVYVYSILFDYLFIGFNPLYGSILVVTLILYLILRYRNIPTLLPSFESDIFLSLWSIFIAGFLSLGVNYVFNPFVVFADRTTLMTLLTLSLIFLLLGRFLFRGVQILLFGTSDNRLQVLIVGVTRGLPDIISKLHRPQAGTEVVGILDNIAKKGDLIGGVPVIGKINTLEEIIDIKSIDVIIQAAGVENVATVMTVAEHRRIRYMVVPHLLGMPSKAIASTNIYNQLFLEPRGTRLTGWAQVFKRLFDFLIALILFIILSPLFLIIAMLVKFSDLRLPVFTGQKRVDGRNGREFTMWRFRTLPRGVHEPVPTAQNFRQFPEKFIRHSFVKTTVLGSFLRKSHLMDLPQLLNVFIGDMGIVGPRPPFAVEYENYDYFDRKRLLIKPGITGAWQIMRKAYTFEEMIQLDKWYVEHWSFWLDLKLLALTIGKFLAGTL